MRDRARPRAALFAASSVGVIIGVAGCSTVSGSPSPGLPGTTTLVRTETVTATATVTLEPSVQADPPGGSDVRFFDGDRLSDGVSEVLTTAPPQGFGLTGVADVRCPSFQPVVVGSVFSCELTVDGRATSSRVEVLSDSGEYRVNPPS